jgi:replicative DNA helicase
MDDLGSVYPGPGYRRGIIDYVPTGLSHLDKCLNGGPCVGTLNVILGRPKSFKSGTLVNIAANAVMSTNPRRAVYFTLEQSVDTVMRRFDCKFTNRTQSFAQEHPQEFLEIWKTATASLAKDYLTVKHYAGLRTTVADLRTCLITLDSKPNLIIVDAAELLLPATIRGETWYEMGDIYKDLRNLAEEFNCVLWTSSQCNREGNKEDVVLTEQHIDASFQKASICDAMISLCQTKEEYRGGILRLFVALSRMSKQHQMIFCTVDYAAMQLHTVGVEEGDNNDV